MRHTKRGFLELLCCKLRRKVETKVKSQPADLYSVDVLIGGNRPDVLQHGVQSRLDPRSSRKTKQPVASIGKNHLCAVTSSFTEPKDKKFT